MKYDISRTDKEIDDLINRCAEQAGKGRSKYPAMTYEQGIRESLEWITDEDTEDPMA